jgi:hypothetical protein
VISTAGAGIIAQVLPVLLLILVVERRALGPTTIPPKGAPGRRKILAVAIPTLIVLAFSFLVEYECIDAVSESTPLQGTRAFAVFVIMLAMGVLVTLTVMDLYMASLMGIDQFRQRKSETDRKNRIRARARHVHRLRKRR